MKSHDISAKLHGLAGALIFAGVMQWFLIVLLAETLFPGYSIRANDLSDLASTVAPHASPLQPSAWLFNATTFLVGLLVLVSALLIHRSGRSSDPAGGDRRLSPAFSVLFALSGLFAMGVGVFPGDTGVIHGLTALGWFVMAPLSAIAFSRRAKGGFAYFSAATGVFALIVLISAFALGNSSPFLALGRGGEERLIAFPVLIWMAALSGRLMSD
ncbi:MAG TPA: DUF998 domain-containing protein [Methanothrix sp.]|nr:DUF998 domain-containing protein [Methanothrix sp.]HPT19389.1 DUF998 domain-containing protein [Methanothrix sp.]